MNETTVRTPTYVSGPLTKEEKDAMAVITAEWIQRAFRTDPIEPDKIIPAIRSLYAVAHLPSPLAVVVVPSPLVMAIAGGIAAAWWKLQNKSSHATQQATWQATAQATAQATEQATRQATQRATAQATAQATEQATWQATGQATQRETQQATEQATRQATQRATQQATEQATRQATDDVGWVTSLASMYLGKKNVPCAVKFILEWGSVYQGGNMWASHHTFYAALRDVLNLRLPVFEQYAAWEQCGIHGGFRFMHEKFCLVSDFPQVLQVDEQHRPHCATGPSHRWRDGWSLWYWHGVAVTEQIILRPDTITGEQIATEKNQQVQAVMIERVGIERACQLMKAKVLHAKSVLIGETSHRYELLELRVGQFRWKHLKMRNPSVPGVYHVEGVPNTCQTVDDALTSRKPAWMQAIPVKEDGLAWYQQGDVYIVPEGAGALQRYPTHLT